MESEEEVHGLGRSNLPLGVFQLRRRPEARPSDPDTTLYRRVVHGRRWSPAEIEELRELFGSRSMLVIAKSLGRTPKAVRSRLVKVEGRAEHLDGFKSKDLVSLCHVRKRVQGEDVEALRSAILASRSDTQFAKEEPF